MEEIIYSKNNNSTISCYSMDFSGISKQNAHGGRNVMPQCLSEGVDIFLKSAERQGGANRRFKASGRCHGWQLEPCPYGLELLYHFSLENSHLETQHQGVMFRSPQAFVASSLTLNCRSTYKYFFNRSTLSSFSQGRSTSVRPKWP